MPLNLKRNHLRYQKYLGQLAEEKQTRVYTGLILTLVTISFFTLFALRPTFLTIFGLIAEIRQKEGILSKLDVKIQRLSLAQTSYSQVAPRLNLIDEALPTTINLSSIIDNLETVAGQSQISFSDLNFEAIDINGGKGELQEINFQSSLEGPFANLKSFLKKIFLVRRIFEGSRFAFSKNIEEDEKEQFLTLSAQLKSFFQTEQAESK